MELVRTIAEMTRYRRATASETVGFVPTMGCLHEGHLSLVRRAASETEHCVVSIFVNPTQFGPREDFGRYPRDLQADIALLAPTGVRVVFAPEAQDMYPADMSTRVRVGGVTELLEGASRPGHFDGVTTIVAKLLNIVRPDKSYFGMKDAQQLAAIRRMTQDLNMAVEVIGCDTVREPDGLAMSSRNTYLSAADREMAVHISRALRAARDLWSEGELRATALEQTATAAMISGGIVDIDYVRLVDTLSFQPIAMVGEASAIVVAARINKIRLIDNIALS